MGQTDEFLEKVRRMEEDEAQRGQNSKKPDPLSEEYLRNEMPEWHSGKDAIKRYHSYLALHGRSICDWCNSIPAQDATAVFHESPIFNGGSRSGWPSGSDRTATVIMHMVELLQQGQSDRVLEAYGLSRGYINKTGDYIHAAHLIWGVMKESGQGPLSDKKDGGQK